MAASSQIALGCLLLVAAAADVRERRIPNAVTVLTCLGGAAVSLSDPAAPRLISSLGAFAAVFVVASVGWRMHLWGGGDAKLAAASATWVGLEGLGAFAAATALAGGVLAISCQAESMISRRRAARGARDASAVGAALAMRPAVPGGDPRCRSAMIPYGAAIAIGAAYVVILQGARYAA